MKYKDDPTPNKVQKEPSFLRLCFEFFIVMAVAVGMFRAVIYLAETFSN